MTNDNARLLEEQRPLSPVQWSAVLGSIALLVWSVPGLIVNPDFATGDAASAENVLGVDMNGWHALSGLLVAIPGLLVASRPRLAAPFVLAAAGTLIATAIWALLENRIAAGLFYFPNNEADALLHLGTSAIFVAGAVHYYLVGRCRWPGRAGRDRVRTGRGHVRRPARVMSTSDVRRPIPNVDDHGRRGSRPWPSSSRHARSRLSAKVTRSSTSRCARH